MKISIIGKFNKLWDEEYIARSFEELGHEVQRIDERNIVEHTLGNIEQFDPAFVLWFKLNTPQPERIVEGLKHRITVCWVFDLYFGYQREHKLSHPCFKATYVFTTDGGHDKEFKERGINHRVLRQGIYGKECYMLPSEPIYDVIFVGSENPYYPERTEVMKKLAQRYKFKWFGRLNTNEVRGEDLNKLYAQTKVVVGDSVYSPNYWSNRVVETLGRGGFLIHREVEGLTKEYQFIATYEDLCMKIDMWLSMKAIREELRRVNLEWVKDNYTATHQCQKLLDYISLKD